LIVNSGIPCRRASAPNSLRDTREHQRPLLQARVPTITAIAKTAVDDIKSMDALTMISVQETHALPHTA
jgi:hypothetical protein